MLRPIYTEWFDTRSLQKIPSVNILLLLGFGSILRRYSIAKYILNYIKFIWHQTPYLNIWTWIFFLSNNLWKVNNEIKMVTIIIMIWDFISKDFHKNAKFLVYLNAKKITFLDFWQSIIS